MGAKIYIDLYTLKRIINFNINPLLNLMIKKKSKLKQKILGRSKLNLSLKYFIRLNPSSYWFSIQDGDEIFFVPFAVETGQERKRLNPEGNQNAILGVDLLGYD